MAFPLLLAAGGLAAAGSLFQGISANNAAKSDARALRSEALREAKRAKEDALRFESEQGLAFLKSGVNLEGTPLMVLEETRREGIKEAENIKQRGSRLANKRRREGRNALIGSFFNAGSAGLRAFA